MAQRVGRQQRWFGLAKWQSSGSRTYKARQAPWWLKEEQRLRRSKGEHAECMGDLVVGMLVDADEDERQVTGQQRPARTVIGRERRTWGQVDQPEKRGGRGEGAWPAMGLMAACTPLRGATSGLAFRGVLQRR